MALPAVAKVAAASNGIRNAKKITSPSRDGDNVTRLLRAANDNEPSATNPTGESLARPPLRNIEHNVAPKPKTSTVPTLRNVQAGGLSRLTNLRSGNKDKAGVSGVKTKAIGWFVAFVTLARECWLLAALWPAQVLFGVISLVGFGMEAAAGEFLGGIFSFVVPGVTVWIVGLGVVLVIGIGSMLTMAVMLRVIHKKAFFAGHRDMYFPLLLSFYLIPFINLVPWVFLWGAYVLQDKDEQSAQK